MTFYSWYCGRFAGVTRMLQEPEVFDQAGTIKQLLKVLEDYERERVEIDRRLEPREP